MTNQAAFFDIVGTIITENPWPYLLSHPALSPSRIQMAKTVFLPIWLGSKVGIFSDMTFRHYWLHSMAPIFKGFSKTQIKSIFDWVVNEQMANSYHEDVLERLQQHRRDGVQVVLVSGMFQGLAEAFAQRVGADVALGSKLAYHNDITTGKMDGKTCVGPRKLDFIRNYLQSNGFSPDLKNHFGYADSFSDLPLLNAVGYPTATHPDEQLHTVAKAQDWTIIS